MREPDYAFFDADNHYYETPDCFTRHIESRYCDRAVRVVRDEAGRQGIWVGERPFTFLANHSFEKAYRPGALREMLRAKRFDDGTTHVAESLLPAYQDRGARLALMDEQGLEACFVFPTLGVCVEHFMKDDPELLYANIRSFNRWLEEDWGYGADGRIYGVPLLSLRDVDLATAELDRLLLRGARILSLRPGPAHGYSPADPRFDPFWARVEEADCSVAFHIGESGYNEMMSVHFGEEANPSSHLQSAFQWSCFYGDRPIMDTMAALIFGNLFGRFPGLRVVLVENGSLFVPYLMRLMDKMGGMGRNGPWPGGRIREKPSAIFKRHVFVSPYHEEDVGALVAEIGASQVLFGSDFPHPEGLASPRDFLEGLAALGDEDVRRVMRDNARSLVGREEPVAR